MKPIEFKESNITLNKPSNMTDKECSSLPVYTDGEQCISCWKPTWKEWWAILIYKKVWLSVFSGTTQSPVWLLGSKTAFEEGYDSKESNCKEL